MELQLHLAEVDDFPLLAEMNADLIREEGSRNPMNVEELKNRMQSWLEGPYQIILIKWLDEIAGYSVFQVHPDEYFPDQIEVYVRQFFIIPTFRRQHIGTHAFQEIMKEYFPATSVRITLDVLESNPQGLLFWQSLGFMPYASTLLLQK